MQILLNFRQYLRHKLLILSKLGFYWIAHSHICSGYGIHKKIMDNLLIGYFPNENYKNKSLWALLVTIVILDAGMCPVLQIKSMLLLWECGMEAIIRKFYVLNVKSRQRNRNYCINVQCILQGVSIWNEHSLMSNLEASHWKWL